MITKKAPFRSPPSYVGTSSLKRMAMANHSAPAIMITSAATHASIRTDGADRNTPLTETYTHPYNSSVGKAGFVWKPKSKRAKRH